MFSFELAVSAIIDFTCSVDSDCTTLDANAECSSSACACKAEYTGAACKLHFITASDKLTEVQLYMSTLCQPGSRVIRAFPDVEKLFLFSDLAVKATKSENKQKCFLTSEKAWINSRVNNFYLHGRRVIATSNILKCTDTLSGKQLCHFHFCLPS